MKPRTRVFLALSVMIVSLVGTVGYAVYRLMEAYYLEQLRTNITGYASCASFLIAGDTHAGFTGPEDTTSPAFVEMRARLRAFMQIDERISGICTMVRTGRQNVWKCIMDASGPEDDGGGALSELDRPVLFGEEYDATPYPELQNAFKGPVADREITRDQRGWRLSAYAPIYSSAHEAVAIVRISISTDSIRQEMSRIRNFILFSSILLVILVLLISGSYTYRLTRRIDEVVGSEQERMHGNERKGPGTSNNAGGLAAAVNSMPDDMEKGFDKLSILSRIANISASSLDLGEALEMSVRLALQATKSTRGAIFLVREDEKSVELATSQGIDGIRSVGEECFVGAKKLPTVLGKDADALAKEWLDATGCTRCFFLTIRDSLRGVFLLDPKTDDEAFLNMLMKEISFGIEIPRLLRDAITDTTTGLFMKRYFQIQLHTETKRSQRYKIGLSLLMVDIDHFKRVNDTFGHQFGDLVLREIAKIITHSVRKTDVVARYGGDEIVIILPDSSKEGARMVADRILTGVQEREFRHDDRTIRLTVSIGISNMSGDEPIPSEQLLRLADSALYEAKEAGKNTIRVA